MNPVDDEESFDALVDRLGMKLGFQEINRICIRESFLPEHAVEFRPAAGARDGERGVAGLSHPAGAADRSAHAH